MQSALGQFWQETNLLLRALLEMGYRDSALLTLTDPEAVAACFAAGAGSEVTRLPFRKIRRPLWPFDLNLERPWTS